VARAERVTSQPRCDDNCAFSDFLARSVASLRQFWYLTTRKPKKFRPTTRIKIKIAA
jgi:hypothetical protein